MSITISITIPEQLENQLQTEADGIGISRSRFIGNILLDWQKGKPDCSNNCVNNNKGHCPEYDIRCIVDQAEAETCAGFKSKG